MKTVVLFFEKGAPTRKVWFYQLDPSRNLGKTNPLSDADPAEFIVLHATYADSPKSWSVDAKTIDPAEDREDCRALKEKLEAAAKAAGLKTGTSSRTKPTMRSPVSRRMRWHPVAAVNRDGRGLWSLPVLRPVM